MWKSYGIQGKLDSLLWGLGILIFHCGCALYHCSLCSIPAWRVATALSDSYYVIDKLTLVTAKLSSSSLKASDIQSVPFLSLSLESESVLAVSICTVLSKNMAFHSTEYHIDFTGWL